MGHTTLYQQTLEECVQAFLIDTSQYFLLVSNNIPVRSQFLDDFTKTTPFINESIVQATIQSADDLEPIFKEHATENIAVYFFHNPNNILLESIRAVIESRRIDAKIILTTSEAPTSLMATNFLLPENLSITTETPDSTTKIPQEPVSLLDIHDTPDLASNTQSAPLTQEIHDDPLSLVSPDTEATQPETLMSSADSTEEALLPSADNLSVTPPETEVLFVWEEETPQQNIQTEEGEVEGITETLEPEPEITTPETLEDNKEDTWEIETEDTLNVSTQEAWELESNVVQDTETVTESETEQKAQEEASEYTEPAFISFRDYAKAQNFPIEASQFFQGNADTEHVLALFEEYIQLGALPEHHSDTSIYTSFDTKMAQMQESLFPKEYEAFSAYLHAIAAQIGSLYKEDQLAQSLGISRRKIKKYTDIILNAGIVVEIKPFFEDSSKELFRHSKLYFTDLAWYKAILGDAFGVGILRSGMIENFAFLELYHKLHTTHDIHCWNKKSGTHIPLVLKTRSTGKLTPIDISIRSAKNISPAMRSFYESYASRIESGMLLNETTAQANVYLGAPYIILPYPII